MKKKYVILMGLAVFLFFSCVQHSGEKKKEVEEQSGHDIEVEIPGSMTIGEHPPSEESFYVFLDKFSTEESFQLDRIKFPIIVTVPNMEDQGMAPMEDTIDKYGWERLDLTYDSTYTTRRYDKYHQIIRFRNDTAVVELRGIDNGIYADYYFRLIDDQWYLVTLNEAFF